MFGSNQRNYSITKNDHTKDEQQQQQQIKKVNQNNHPHHKINKINDNSNMKQRYEKDQQTQIKDNNIIGQYNNQNNDVDEDILQYKSSSSSQNHQSKSIQESIQIQQQYDDQHESSEYSICRYSSTFQKEEQLINHGNNIINKDNANNNKGQKRYINNNQNGNNNIKCIKLRIDESSQIGLNNDSDINNIKTSKSKNYNQNSPSNKLKKIIINQKEDYIVKDQNHNNNNSSSRKQQNQSQQQQNDIQQRQFRLLSKQNNYNNQDQQDNEDQFKQTLSKVHKINVYQPQILQRIMANTQNTNIITQSTLNTQQNDNVLSPKYNFDQSNRNHNQNNHNNFLKSFKQQQNMKQSPRNLSSHGNNDICDGQIEFLPNHQNHLAFKKRRKLKKKQLSITQNNYSIDDTQPIISNSPKQENIFQNSLLSSQNFNQSQHQQADENKLQAQQQQNQIEQKQQQNESNRIKQQQQTTPISINRLLSSTKQQQQNGRRKSFIFQNSPRIIKNVYGIDNNDDHMKQIKQQFQEQFKEISQFNKNHTTIDFYKRKSHSSNHSSFSPRNNHLIQSKGGNTLSIHKQTENNNNNYNNNQIENISKISNTNELNEQIKQRRKSHQPNHSNNFTLPLVISHNNHTALNTPRKSHQKQLKLTYLNDEYSVNNNNNSNLPKSTRKQTHHSINSNTISFSPLQSNNKKIQEENNNKTGFIFNNSNNNNNNNQRSNTPTTIGGGTIIITQQSPKLKTNKHRKKSKTPKNIKSNNNNNNNNNQNIIHLYQNSTNKQN